MSRRPGRDPRRVVGVRRGRQRGIGLEGGGVPLPESLEGRLLLATALASRGLEPAPLRVVLVSDAVEQAAEVVASASPDAIALTYDSRSTDSAGLVDLLGAVSEAHCGARITRLGLVAHGGEGRIDVGAGATWDLANIPAIATDLDRLRDLLAPGAELDLYSCSVAAGPDGKRFVDQIAAMTGASVSASIDPVGSGDLGDFDWEYSTAPAASTPSLLSVDRLEQINGLQLDDAYEPNDTKLEVDAQPVGGANSPNLGPLASTKIINNLAMEDAADWFRFQTQGVGTTANSITVTFNITAGDLDLYLYGSDGTTIVRSATNSYYGNTSPETISLAGVPSGVYYAKVVPHATGGTIANYTLQVAAPGATGDDQYEPNDTKLEVDAQPVGGVNSPNLGVLTATRTINNLVIDDAADWYKFQTQGVGTTANSITVSYDVNAGDVDLYLYASDGTTLVRSATNSYYGNASPETISLAGVPSGVYYAKVVPHAQNFGIANYTLQVAAPGATGDDQYEPNDTKLQVDAQPVGGVNSPNLGVLTATRTINNLVIDDAADWYKFQTQGVGTTANSITVSYDVNAGDVDLYLYASDGTTLVRSATNSYYGNASPETISLAGVPSGVYYAKVVPHAQNFGIANYALQVAAPGATGDDPYEDNDSKLQVDAKTAGAPNSPNLGVLTATRTINNLVIDDAADWYKFQTQGVGTTANSITVSYDVNAGDVDLYLYASDGTTLVRSATNSYYGNASPETISLAGVPSGVYYAKVVPHAQNFGIANYALQVAAPGATGDDPYEDNDSKLQVDAKTAGAPNSPNLGVLTATRTINNLVIDDAADWYKFQTQGVGTTANSITVSYDVNAGDVDLYLYASDGTTLVRSATNSYYGNASPETISLAGVPSGVYYAKVVPHAQNFGIANYTLQVAAPGATGDDPYEDNDSKLQVDAKAAGAPNSPNLGLLTDLETIQHLIMNDGADWYRFQTASVGTAANTVVIDFLTAEGDLDLYLYGSDGITLIRAATNSYYGNASPETISLSGLADGSYYIKVVPHDLKFGIADYALQIAPPPGGANPGTIQFGSPTYTVNEGGTATVTLSRTSGIDGAVTVNYATSDGSAKAGLDYVAKSGTVTFAAGAISASFTVPTIDDLLFEGDESIGLTLSAPAGGAVLGPQTTAVLTIQDDEQPVPGSFQFSTTSYSVGESAGAVTITVSRVGGSNGNVTVNFATADGTATAGLDYAATSGTLVFADGETSKPFSIPILDDGLVEGDETVALTLSAPTGGATLGTKDATLTILDDDVTQSPPTLQFSAASYRVDEAVGAARITVSRTGDPTAAVSVHYATANRSAIAGVDYYAANGTLNFAAGEMTKVFFVGIINDKLDEPDETVALTLSAPTGGATLGTKDATLTILDDDTPQAPPTLQFLAATSSVDEAGGAARITVTRTGDPTAAVSVHYATANRSAIAGVDYYAANGTLNFAAGEMTKVFFVGIINDKLDEPDETVALTLSAPTGGATLGTKDATLTILDDDEAPGTVQFSAASYRVGESDGLARIYVTRTGGKAAGITVHYATANKSATAGLDYYAASGTLTFAAGETIKAIPVGIRDDAIYEGDETVDLILSAPGGGARLGPRANATLTIADDERPRPGVFNFERGDYRVAEGAGTARITVNRGGGGDGAVTVQYAIGDGTATAGLDYARVSGTINFAPGQTSQSFIVPILDDRLVEDDEVARLYIGAPGGGATLGTATIATLTILDDDQATTATLSSDYDGDGKADIAVYGYGRFAIAQSGGGFSNVAIGGPGYVAVPGDYDGDGKIDVAVYGNGAFTVFKSTGGTTYTPIGGAGYVPVPADYDGDGKADVAVYGNGALTVFKSSGGTTATPIGGAGYVPAVGDYDGDGKADVAVYGDGAFTVFKSTGGTTYTPYGDKGFIPVQADYDGDGKTDVALYGDGAFFVRESGGGEVRLPFGGPGFKPVIGDFDGDGKADVAAYGDGSFYVLKSTGGLSVQAWGGPADVPVTSPGASGVALAVASSTASPPRPSASAAFGSSARLETNAILPLAATEVASSSSTRPGGPLALFGVRRPSR